MAIIIEKGNAVSVDHNKYDLTLDEAAKELAEGRAIIAREFEDYDDEQSFPSVDNLKPCDYEGMKHEEIVDSLRCYYESFGRAATP